MLNLVIFGPPGCGKGTQSLRIARRYGLVHLSSGEIFRNEIRSNTLLGDKVRDVMNKGLLIPDNIVLKRLYKAASRFINTPGIIFDGFPRTLFQAQMLDRLLNKKCIPLNLAIFMLVDKDELMARLVGRSEDSGRMDDCRKVIDRRMAVYEEETKPLREYYIRQRKILQVSGMAPVDEVSAKIARAIDFYIEKDEIIPEVI